jgi:CO dehydrogenase maturation factor
MGMKLTISGKDDLVILDFEAGLEHLGRATARGVDLMIIVAEPSLRAVETVRKIKSMASEIGIQRCVVIGNKIATAADRTFLEHSFSAAEYLGGLPLDETIRTADRGEGFLLDRLKPSLLEQVVFLWTAVQASVNQEELIL